MQIFKVPMKFADVFVLSIDPEKEEIVYEVRDKDSGVLVEPRRTTKYIISGQMTFFDAREIPTPQFNLIYETLK